MGPGVTSMPQSGGSGEGSGGSWKAGGQEAKHGG